MLFQDFRAGGDGGAGGGDVVDDPQIFSDDIERVAVIRVGCRYLKRVFHIFFSKSFVANGHLRSGMARSNEPISNEGRGDIFRKAFMERFREDIGLIPSAPSLSSRVKGDGEKGIGEWQFGLKESTSEERAEGRAEIADESVFEEVNDAGDSWIIVSEGGKNSVMRGSPRARKTEGAKRRLSRAAVSADLRVSTRGGQRLKTRGAER